MTTTDQRPFPVTGADPVAQAATLLMRHAGVDTWPIGRTDQVALLRRARVRTHPDRHGGNRSLWDSVDDAAQVLGLVGASR